MNQLMASHERKNQRSLLFFNSTFYAGILQDRCLLGQLRNDELHHEKFVNDCLE
jgi:hypothetical protein